MEEHGELQLGLLQVKYSEKRGGDKPGQDKEISTLLNIVKSSPNNGTIKLTINPTKELQVGDELEIKVSLTTPDEPIEEIIWIKVIEPDYPKEPTPKEESFENIGLPELVKVAEKDWDALEGQGIPMNHNTVMYPAGEGDKLEKVYINLDSRVFLSHRTKLKSEEQITTAQKKYLSSVYFHALFLYMITKKRNYNIAIIKDGKQEDVTVHEYIQDVFDSYYSDFLLNFGMEQLMGALE